MSAVNINLPDDRRYTAEHIWAKLELEGLLAGISDFAQRQLDNIMFVDLPEPGTRFEAGEVFGSVESVKSVNDLYMPVSGCIIAVNEILANSPDVVNRSSYEAGWMICIQPDETDSLEMLLDAETYRSLL